MNGKKKLEEEEEEEEKGMYKEKIKNRKENNSDIYTF